MTIENYIITYQGIHTLNKWTMYGCEAFDNEYKIIKNVTIAVANMLLYPTGQCTWSGLINSEEYSQLVQCTSMHHSAF